MLEHILQTEESLSPTLQTTISDILHLSLSNSHLDPRLESPPTFAVLTLTNEWCSR